VYLRARWYNPATGTFTSRDPFPGVDTSPQSLHPYAYTHNNPVNATDPSGMCVFAAGLDTVACVGVAIIFLVAAGVTTWATYEACITQGGCAQLERDILAWQAQGNSFSPGPAPQTRSTPPLPQRPPPLTSAPHGDATGDMAVCAPFPLPNEVSPWLQPGWGAGDPFPPVTSFPLPESRGLGVFAAQQTRSVVGYRGRLEQIDDTIDPSDLGTGTETNRSSRSLARRLGLPTDDAGHARGRQLGGRGGVNDQNIFSQSPHINRGIYQQLEGEVADYVQRTGISVDIRVTFHYHTPTDTRPYAVTYEALQGGTHIPDIPPRSFLNPP
jgi:hypothetical protein